MKALVSNVLQAHRNLSRIMQLETVHPTLRRHLTYDHIDTWVSICAQNRITIEAKAIAKKLDAYHNTCDQSVKQDNGATHQKFSREAFVDVIVERIVTDIDFETKL